VNRSHTKGIWRGMVDMFKNVFEVTKGEKCPIKDPSTGKIPAYLLEK